MDRSKYRISGAFNVPKGTRLQDACNAPAHGGGVYLVYATRNATRELVYIGSCGHVATDGGRVDRDGGIRARLLKGKQFGTPRTRSWPAKIEEEQLSSLDVEWHITLDDETRDVPRYVEAVLIQEFFAQNRRLPRWHKEL